MFLTRFFWFHHVISSSLSTSSQSQRLQSFDGSLVGVCNMSIGLRFCVEHGTWMHGFTGVSPVPPSMRLSKLNIPDDGVLTEMPAMSATFFRARKSDGLRLAGTLRDEGRFGFWDLKNVGVFSWGMYGVVGVVMSISCPEILKRGKIR